MRFGGRHGREWVCIYDDEDWRRSLFAGVEGGDTRRRRDRQRQRRHERTAECSGGHVGRSSEGGIVKG